MRSPAHNQSEVKATSSESLRYSRHSTPVQLLQLPTTPRRHEDSHESQHVGERSSIFQVLDSSDGRGAVACSEGLEEPQECAGLARRWTGRLSRSKRWRRHSKEYCVVRKSESADWWTSRWSGSSLRRASSPPLVWAARRGCHLVSCKRAGIIAGE